MPDIALGGFFFVKVVEPFPLDENWELRIEHWSDQDKSDQCSILNSQFSSEEIQRDPGWFQGFAQRPEISLILRTASSMFASEFA